jgi:hypothetical protein
MERKFHAEGMLHIRPDAGAWLRRRPGFVTARSRQGLRYKSFRLQGQRTAPANYSNFKRFPKTTNDSFAREMPGRSANAPGFRVKPGMTA